MADIVSPEKRSRMMSGIRGKNTKPEIQIRKLLHATGYRFRLHRKDLPGNPDIVLPRHHVVIFVHGCFWHGHENCHLFRLPKSRTDFWKKKINSNRERDQRNYSALQNAGWNIVVIWECAVDKKLKLDSDKLEAALLKAVAKDRPYTEIRGRIETESN